MDEMHKKEPLQAVVKKHRGPSLVWIIPLVTLLAGGWLVAKYIAERGPAITITFKTAEGIEKKTPIKYKDVQIGVVKQVRFSKDFSRIELTARMSSTAENFLREGTRFWVVRPNLSLHGVTGLSTLFSGGYIAVDPGEGDAQYEFDGIDEAPTLTSDADGVRITLTSERLGSLDIGTPVYYKGIPAGKILDYELSKDEQRTLIHAFIKRPYDVLIHRNSHFWNISGINASVGSDGFRLQSPSLLTMVLGGIEFDSPMQDANIKPGDKTEAGDKIFRLYASYDDILETAYQRKVRFVTYFDQSIHGLDVGASVEFQGIEVGKIANISLQFDQKRNAFRIPVTLEIEPERMPGEHPDNQQVLTLLQGLMKKGLRAQLQTSSLLTGKLYVALNMHPDDLSPHRVADDDNKLPEIPSVRGGIDQIQTSVQKILSKIEKLDTRQIGKDTKASLHAFRHVIESLEPHAEPLALHLDETVVQAKKTLESLDRVLDSASPTQYHLDQTSRDLSDMARSIRAFVEMLERHPNALIFGNSTSGEK